MILDAFKASMSDSEPPPDLSPPLAAPWWAGRGDGWARAHALVQDAPGTDAAWVHAYLHRVEGDLGNAGYWYRQAGRPKADESLPAEWEAIVVAAFTPSASPNLPHSSPPPRVGIVPRA